MPGSVLVAGESLVDVVIGPDGHTIEVTPGGAPLNVAVGLARLDVPTRLLTAFGPDPHGDLVGRHLQESGVRLQPGSDAAGRTAVARASLDAQHRATYEFELSWDPPPATLPSDLQGLHVGSLGTVVEPGAARIGALAAQARAAGVVVSYDPNVRPAALAAVPDPWHDVRGHAAGATVVKLSDEDAQHLQPGRALDDLLDELLGGEHTLLAAVTRGEHGLRMATRDHRIDVPAPPVDVVDTVGAGDACMAGLLAGLHAREQLETQALGSMTESDLAAVGAAAVEVAALTCSRRGANPPWRRELRGGPWRPQPR
ncbi:MAG TPA: PfkB family carbohydrate kinase [Nocardioidaceae bacterium]|nr:PfkB family carbohydrate kinase [Nocardioidaceae bacterium]